MINSREKATTPQNILVFNSADLHNDDINRLRNQLWIGLMVTTFFILSITLISLISNRFQNCFTLDKLIDQSTYDSIEDSNTGL